MYAVYRLIYKDGKLGKRLIYAPNSGEDGYSITSGKFEKGVNIAGSLSIVVPPTNPSWKYYFEDGTEADPHPERLTQGTIITVEVIQDGTNKETWRGRVILQSWDIYRNMTLECEGILAYFNDILLPPYNFSWTGIISQAYDPSEGLKFFNIDALKDFLPNLTDDGIVDAIGGVVDNVINNDSFTTDAEELYGTLTDGMPVPTYNEDGTPAEDNTDRRVTIYDYLLFILTIYNTELTQDPVDKIKQIKIGYVDPAFKTEQYLINHKTTQYTNVWQEISSNIIDIYGGIMFLSNWYIDKDGNKVYDPNSSYLYYYKDYSGEAKQIIQYGENLVDFEMESDGTERVTRWYVFGKVKDSNGNETLVDMSSVNNGLKYFTETFEIGTITNVEYTDLTTPQDCYNRAVANWKKSFWGKDTITVNAVDLNMVDHSIESFEPGYKVKLLMDNNSYSMGGIDMRLETISIDLLSPENSEYTFKQTVSG